MTTAPSTSLASLNCVPAAIRNKPRYVGDHVIRHYRGRGLAQLLTDLGADPSTPSLEIFGGIGRLVMHADGSETWHPAIPGEPQPQAPIPAAPALAASRLAICQACHAWAERCTATGCACTGQGRPEIWSSRCPLDRWPPPGVPTVCPPTKSA